MAGGTQKARKRPDSARVRDPCPSVLLSINFLLFMHVFRSNTLPTYKLRCSFYGQAKRKPSWPPKTPKDTKTTSHRLLISIQGSPFVASRVFRGPASLVAALPRCVYPWLAVPALPLASLRLGVRNFRKFFAAESHRENSWGASPGEGLGRAVQPLGWLFPPCPLWLCESKSGTHVLTEAQRKDQEWHAYLRGRLSP